MQYFYLRTECENVSPWGNANCPSHSKHNVEGLTSQREVHRDGAHGGECNTWLLPFWHRNMILSHQVDVILSCWCISVEREHAFLLLELTNEWKMVKKGKKKQQKKLHKTKKKLKSRGLHCKIVFAKLCLSVTQLYDADYQRGTGEEKHHCRQSWSNHEAIHQVFSSYSSHCTVMPWQGTALPRPEDKQDVAEWNVFFMAAARVAKNLPQSLGDIIECYQQLRWRSKTLLAFPFSMYFSLLFKNVYIVLVLEVYTTTTIICVQCPNITSSFIIP